jgi:hypothetical protein
VIRVRVGEEQVQLARAQFGRDRSLFLRDLLGQLRIAGGELVELDQVAGAFFELLPGLDQLSVLGPFPGLRARAARVVPDPGLGQEVVEFLGSLELGGQVKGAPSAAGCARAAPWDSAELPSTLLILRGKDRPAPPGHDSASLK